MEILIFGLIVFLGVVDGDSSANFMQKKEPPRSFVHKEKPETFEQRSRKMEKCLSHAGKSTESKVMVSFACLLQDSKSKHSSKTKVSKRAHDFLTRGCWK